ncbi:microtubule motor activity protein [Parelaphostrongylus tenuis]|uniref:Kinesin-like protein n=1 Tax=Parelaphostrongylus tenuis TaxID=148309 RepID=A0AAD5R580_PARTN|nr:microtubule motor activity protein [Parelaphostrongylus tenuis]
MAAAEFIRVVARVRPPSTAQQRIVTVCDDRVLCFNPSDPKYFTFDSVFGEDVTQDQVFEDARSRIVDGCIDGYNGTIFAYGESGSGKTHTMFGPSDIENCLVDVHQQGIVPRACHALFKKLSSRAAENGGIFSYDVSCRFVELYNEEFYDLLSPLQQKLSIRSDSKGVQLLGACEHKVHCAIDMIRTLEIGWNARRRAATAMNRELSRSHIIFTVNVKTEELVNTILYKKRATLNLVDLAGSEKQTQSKWFGFGDRFREAVEINPLLTILGRVMRILSGLDPLDEHVPYRDSKLTHILLDSLGVNSRTTIIVNVHPEKGYCSGTLSTLQFAAECRKIENHVRANEDIFGDTVMAYRSEIARLRQEIRLTEERTRSDPLFHLYNNITKLSLKVVAIEEELKRCKEMAMSREKAQIQCDLLFAQLLSKTSREDSIQSHDEVLRDILSQLWKRIDSMQSLGNLTNIGLENDLSDVGKELSHLRHLYESAESARRTHNEKYNNLLEEYNKWFLENSLRRLDANSSCLPPHAHHEKRTMAQGKEERHQTLCTQAANSRDWPSRAFRPILMEENKDGDPQTQGVFSEKSSIKDMCGKQKSNLEQWTEEKNSLMQTELSLNARMKDLQREKSILLEDLKEWQQRTQFLSADLSSCDDEKYRLEHLVEKLRSEKLDLEKRLRVIQNENGRLVTEVEGILGLDTASFSNENGDVEEDRKNLSGDHKERHPEQSESDMNDASNLEELTKSTKQAVDRDMTQRNDEGDGIQKTCYNCLSILPKGTLRRHVQGRLACNPCGKYCERTGHHRPEYLWRGISKKRIRWVKRGEWTCYNCLSTIPEGAFRKRVQGKMSCNSCRKYYERTGRHRPEQLWRKTSKKQAQKVTESEQREDPVANVDNVEASGPFSFRVHSSPVRHSHVDDDVDLNMMGNLTKPPVADNDITMDLAQP